MRTWSGPSGKSESVSESVSEEALADELVTDEDATDDVVADDDVAEALMHPRQRAAQDRGGQPLRAVGNDERAPVPVDHSEAVTGAAVPKVVHYLYRLS